MADEKTSRRSGRRRRRRRPRKSQRTSQQTTGKKSASGKQKRPRQERDDLPDVFIYTYTIYKSGD